MVDRGGMIDRLRRGRWSRGDGSLHDDGVGVHVRVADGHGLSLGHGMRPLLNAEHGQGRLGMLVLVGRDGRDHTG